MDPGRPLAWLATWAVRRPRTALLTALAACLLLAAPALTLRLEVDLVRLLPDGSPAVARFRELADAFGASDQAFVAVEIADPKQVNDPAMRARAAQVTDAIADALLASRWTAADGREEPLLLGCDGRGDPTWRTALLDRVGGETWRFLNDGALDTLIARLQPRVLDKRLRLGPPPDLPPEVADRDLLALWRDCYLPAWQQRTQDAGPVTRSGGHLVGQGGRFHLLILRPAHPAHDRAFTLHFTTLLNDLAQQHAADPASAGLIVHRAGGHFIAAADYRIARSAAMSNLWQGAIAVALMLAIAFRSLRLPALVLVALVPSTIAAFGAARLLCGPDLSMVVAAFAAVLIGLGVDVLIHLYSSFGRHLAADGAPGDGRPSAALAAARELATSVLGATATTLVAFAVLGGSDFRGLRQLGAMAAAGMLIMLVVLFVVVPAILARWGPRTVLQPPLGALGRNLASRPWPWLGMAVAAAIAGAVILAQADPLLRFDSRARELRPAQDPVFTAQRDLAQALGLPMDQVQFLITGDDREAVAETGALLVQAATALDGQRRIRLAIDLPARLPESVEAPGVSAARGPRLFTTPVGRLRVERIDDGRVSGLRWLDGAPSVPLPAGTELVERPLLRAPPSAVALAAPSRQRAVMERLAGAIDWPAIDQRLSALTESERQRWSRAIADLTQLHRAVAERRVLTPGDLLDSPLGSAIRAMWAEDGTRVRMAVRLSAPDLGQGVTIADLCRAVGTTRDGGPWRDAPASIAVTGVPVLGEALGEALVADLRRLGLWAALAVGATLVLIVGLRIAWRASLVLTVSMAMTLAAMHACGLAWNPMNSAAAPLLLGMGVDAAIYVLYALDRQPRHRGGVRAALDEVAGPVLLNSLTTIVGFATLLLNPYRGVQSLGLVAVLGMTACLFTALVAVPALAAVTSHRRQVSP